MQVSAVSRAGLTRPFMPGLDLWPWVPGPGLDLNWHLALCHLGAGTCPRRAESTPRASSPTGLVERTFQAKHLGKGRLRGVMGSQHFCPPGNVRPGCSPAKWEPRPVPQAQALLPAPPLALLLHGRPRPSSLLPCSRLPRLPCPLAFLPPQGLCTHYFLFLEL